jgi:nicotinamidase-related amidase
MIGKHRDRTVSEEFDPFDRRCVHLCVDMQRMFAEDTPWHSAWLHPVLPRIVGLVELGPAATIFTRFIPPQRGEDANGEWMRYYRRWSDMTLDRMSPDMVELVPELARFVPPARVVDKAVYSPWHASLLHRSLRRRGVETIIISGGETDVCVLGTVLGAIDHGFHVVLARDCLYSSSDEAHDATVLLCRERYSSHLSALAADEIASAWRPERL